MAQRAELLQYLDELLEPGRFQDYCPNGLQVEGGERVERIVSGVTASRALLERAIAVGADTVLVHHGYFWKGEDPCVTGMKARRLALLLGAGVNLLAYHLPLDAHPVYGNNRQLAERLGIVVTGELDTGHRPALGLHGELPAAQPVTELRGMLAARLGREPLHVAGGPARIRTLAWCSGAGQDFIDAAARQGVDAYLSGEISERTAHAAREQGLHYFAIGHHASERYGVAALGAHLAQRFAVWHEYVEVDNPA